MVIEAGKEVMKKIINQVSHPYSSESFSLCCGWMVFFKDKIFLFAV